MGTSGGANHLPASPNLDTALPTLSPPPDPPLQDRENPQELRLSGSGPAELGELSAGEDEEEEPEPEPPSKSLLRIPGWRTSSSKGLGGARGFGTPCIAPEQRPLFSHAHSLLSLSVLQVVVQKGPSKIECATS